MLNCTAKLLYQLIPAAFPHNLAKGDVFEVIQLLKTAQFDDKSTPLIYNQDLAGFFTSIDTDRLVYRHLMPYFLPSTMSTQSDEIL